MSELVRTLRSIYAVAALIFVTVFYLAYASGSGIIDKKYTILSVERYNVISKLQTQAAALQHSGLTSNETAKSIASLIRELRQWEAAALTSYATIEIAPYDYKTGEAYFPSVLTGRPAQESLLAMNTQSETPENMFVQDHRGKMVFRVSGLAKVGLNTFVVNADLDAMEVLKRYGIRIVLHILVVFMVLWLVAHVRHVRGSVSMDKSENRKDSTLLSRIMSEVLEAIETDIVVAEIHGDTSSIIYASNGFYDRMGYDYDTLEGQHLEIFVAPEDKEKHRQNVLDFYHSEDNIPRRVVEPVKRDGTRISVSLSVQRTNYVRNKRYLVASIRDKETAD